MLVFLRIIGVFNAAIWFGSAFFFTFGVGPGVFSEEMRKFFPGEYTGVIGQVLITRYFAFQIICSLIALAHFLAEMIYAGRPFRRASFGLIALLLALGLMGQYFFAPRISALHKAKYHGPIDLRPAATTQLKQLHGISMAGNLLGLIALVIYTWQVTNSSESSRFVNSGKFRS